jgi:hypothetical protein
LLTFHLLNRAWAIGLGVDDVHHGIFLQPLAPHHSIFEIVQNPIPQERGSLPGWAIAQQHISASGRPDKPCSFHPQRLAVRILENIRSVWRPFLRCAQSSLPFGRAFETRERIDGARVEFAAHDEAREHAAPPRRKIKATMIVDTALIRFEGDATEIFANRDAKWQADHEPQFCNVSRRSR